MLLHFRIMLLEKIKMLYKREKMMLKRVIEKGGTLSWDARARPLIIKRSR